MGRGILTAVPVLALDTSAAVAVAVTDDAGVTLTTRSVPDRRHHAELLAPLITAVLADAGVERGRLTAVVVGTGPAPYTGLRVGLVTALMLGRTLGIPVHGVSSLDALAAQAVTGLGLVAGDAVLVATDARRSEVYHALYRVDALPGGDRVAPRLTVLAGPAVDTPAQAAATGAGAPVVGRGARLYPDVLPLAAGAPLDPDPAALARLALDRLAAARAAGVEHPGLPAVPLYLRRPDATPPAQRKRALG